MLILSYVANGSQHQDCECNGPALIHFYMATPEQQKVLQEIQDLLRRPPGPFKSPDGPIKVTEIPAAVFSSDQMDIHNHYCEKRVKDRAWTMTVDSKGDNVRPEPHLKKWKAGTKRTPPPNADSYPNFLFDLSFTPQSAGRMFAGLQFCIF